MMVVLVLLLLLAAALGILGAVVKAVLVVALGFVLAIVILVAIGYYWFRHRVRQFVRETQTRQAQAGGSGRGYPTTGTKGPGPQLPE